MERNCLILHRAVFHFSNGITDGQLDEKND